MNPDDATHFCVYVYQLNVKSINKSKSSQLVNLHTRDLGKQKSFSYSNTINKWKREGHSTAFSLSDSAFNNAQTLSTRMSMRSCCCCCHLFDHFSCPIFYLTHKFFLFSTRTLFLQTVLWSGDCRCHFLTIIIFAWFFCTVSLAAVKQSVHCKPWRVLFVYTLLSALGFFHVHICFKFVFLIYLFFAMCMKISRNNCE